MTTTERAPASTRRSGAYAASASAQSLIVLQVLQSQGVDPALAMAAGVALAAVTGAAGKWARDQKHQGNKRFHIFLLSNLT